MKKFENILTALKDKNPLNFLYANGYTPDSVKEEIVSTLKPFFSNQDNLEEYAIRFMVSDWIEFLKVKTFNPDCESLLTEIIWHYNKAKLKNPESVYLIINSLMTLQLDAGNKYWSMLKLELDKSKLEIEEFVQTSMKDIHDFIEGLMKVFLYENLAIDRINRNKTIDINKIKFLDLGVIVEELATNSPYCQIFIVPPENLRLSDWRNISAHQNHKVLLDNKIQCEYGQKDNRKTIILTRDELFDRVKRIYYVLQLLNLSHKFFSFDNLKSILASQPMLANNNAREEMSFLLFASGISSQGFEIESVNYQKNGDTILVVKDLTDEEPMKRGIHASQFTYELWYISESNTSTVEYKTKDGKSYLKSRTTKEVCEKIKSGEKQSEYLAETIELKLINSEQPEQN